jgi:hypothetical protein
MHQTVSPANSSLFSWFNNPRAQVSAHFWVGGNGQIEQYVDTARAAWHGVRLNPTYVGIEFGGYPTEALTAAQIAAGGRILAEGARIHGWPLQEINMAGQRGFGFHRMAGSGTSTACPSDLRLRSRGAILNAARGGKPTQPPTTAPKPPAPQPGGGSPAYPGRLLRQGVRGEDVRTWQRRMIQLGFKLNGGADGIYGPSSAANCRTLQQQKKIGVDGIVGPITWRATFS